MQPNQPIQQPAMQQYPNQQPPMQQCPNQQPQNDNQRQLPPLPKISNQQTCPNIALYQQKRQMVRPISSTGSFQSGSFQSGNFQSGNISCQSSRLSLGGMSSNQSMDSMESSQSMLSQQPSQTLLPTQTFPVIYNNNTYMVDPALLMNASLKFRELIQPFIQNNQVRSDIKLQIVGYDFSNRNVNNFLRLCQSLPTDVQNDEMKEICELAKMFQAEKIYDTGASFVQNNLDQNFNIPDSKYDGSDGKTYMFIECDSHVIHHINVNDLDFEEDIEDDDEDDEDEENDNQNENDNENENSKENGSHNENETGNVKNNNKENGKENGEKKTKKIKSVIYVVRSENHKIKCPVYHFSCNEEVLFSAKQKGNNIYISKGDDIHINDGNDNHIAHIYQDNANNNFIFINHDQLTLKYVDSGKPNTKSVAITFPYKDRKITWTPKTPKFNAIKNKFYLNFHGEYHHHPLHSKRNIVLQNPEGHPTFICRKMGDEVFELEALPVINPLIIFAIGLSDIVGPYNGLKTSTTTM